MDFRKYVREKINKKDHIIEFGPLNRPLFEKKDFKNIFYADIRSTEDVIALYKGNDYLKKTGLDVDISTIVNIDYKIKNTYKETFKSKKFNVAYLSHVIEHIPNIINFFQEVYDILEEDGKLIIIYPDKRYCFDHFRNSVSFRDAYATYINGTKENARLAFDFAYNVVHENNPTLFWKGENLTDVISQNNLTDAKKYFDNIESDSLEDDVHFWPFSDYEFLKFIYEMKRANLLYFEIEEYYPTEENNQEFMIILKKKDKKTNNIKKIEALIRDNNPEKFRAEMKKNNEKLTLDIISIIENNTSLIKEKENIIFNNQELITTNNMLILQNNDLLNQISLLNKATEELNQRVSTSELNILKLNFDLVNQMELNKKTVEENNQLQIDNKKIENEKNQLDEGIKKILNSKSMKLTRPLRKIFQIINKER